MHAATLRQSQALQILPVMLVIVGMCLLVHPYAGLIHDSRLYTLQALNHLHPELFGNDVFLKYGSQDDYTVFSRLYAGVIALFDVEPAAKAITFTSVVALLLSFAKLARTLMPARLAWLAIGLFVIVPGFYGEGLVFAVIEEFVTPRMLAESLVLLSVITWLKEKRFIATTLLLAALLVHPIMAFPGMVLLFVLGWGLPHWRRLLALTLIGLVIASFALGGWIPIHPLQFDDAWRRVAHWAHHLLLSKWTISDWARVASIFVTLGFAVHLAPSPARRLALATLITCCLLLLLAWIGGDLLDIALVVQGQAWRCLWIATTLAVLLLPLVVARCWEGSALQRSSALLLIGSWVLQHQSLGLLFTALALIAILLSERSVPDRVARLAEPSAWMLLGAILVCIISVEWTDRIAKVADGTYAASWFEALRLICDDRIAPAAVLICAWFLSGRIRSLRQAGILTACAAVPTALVLGPAAHALEREYYPQEARDAFASWREVIPPGTDVLWAIRFIPESDPVGAWLLLERPSYYSSVQYNSGLFSREAAMELIKRYNSIPRALPTEQPIPVVYRGDAIQTPVCADLPVKHVVAEVRIPDAALIPAPAQVGPPFDRLQLQICP